MDTPKNLAASADGPTQVAVVRSANMLTTLREIVSSPDGISRAELARRTGLTRVTTSRFADEFLACGLAVESSPQIPGGRGRPAANVYASRGRYIAIGLDLNVRFTHVVVINYDGEVLAECVRSYQSLSRTPNQALHRTYTLISQALSAARREFPEPELLGIGIGLPGVISHGNPPRVSAPNAGWHDASITALEDISEQFGAPTCVANEANMAGILALTSTPLIPPDPANYIYVFGDYGIGGALLVNGRLFKGVNGQAGEVGHVCADPDGDICGCGARGCLELFLGRANLLRAAGLPDDASAADLRAAYDAGEAAPRAALARAGQALGRVIGGIVNVIDIPDVVIGGWLRDLLPVLEQEARSELERQVLGYAPGIIRFHPATQGPAGAAIGAGFWAIRDYLNDPTKIIDRYHEKHGGEDDEQPVG